MPDQATLGFDTSSGLCSAALAVGRSIVAHRQEPIQRARADRLFPLIEEMLADANLEWTGIDIVGVGVGPGNFTGIRIGVSASRGLALSLGIPAIGVNRFDIMSRDTRSSAVITIAAKGGKVFCRIGPDGNPFFTTIDSIEVPESEARVFVGHEAENLAEKFGGTHAEPSLTPGQAVALIAAERSSAQHPLPTPLYLRPPNATPMKAPNSVADDPNHRRL